METRPLTCHCQPFSPSPIGLVFLTDRQPRLTSGSFQIFCMQVIKAFSWEIRHVYFNILRLFAVQDLDVLFSEHFSALHQNLLYFHLFCTVSRNVEIVFSVSFQNQNNLNDLVYIVAS